MQYPPICTPIKPQLPEQEHLKCPRCDSMNTKFCYYNNYNLCQPRHFCKDCKRYWTKGGVLRNIPVGGGSRKTTKRSSSSNKKGSSMTLSWPSPAPRFPSSSTTTSSASFSSLLASSIGGHFGGFLDGSGMRFGVFPVNPNRNSGSGLGSDCVPQVEKRLQSGSVENGGKNGWPDLTIYGPGATSQ